MHFSMQSFPVTNAKTEVGSRMSEVGCQIEAANSSFFTYSLFI